MNSRHDSGGSAVKAAGAEGATLSQDRRKPLRPKIIRNKALRAQVEARDHGICCNCQRYSRRWIHDHVLPLSLGGSDTLENSQTLCPECERPKTSTETTKRAKADRLAERDQLTKMRRAIR